MTELKTKMDSTTLTTRVGLEIHVQLGTKSKMFCSCDNNAEGKLPNSVVCPVCLGLPGALPVANAQAIIWTIKTGLAFNCKIPKIAKFDRKHYFYPDLPKGYQISQYDEPFCVGGSLEVEGEKIRLNRIHLEEDAGKLIHKDGKSLVDLNRAGTPLMEIVTEPDITSPKLAGDFLRRLQKIVRDEVTVSFADMEKGHMRCDANISVSGKRKAESGKQEERMSPIIELKNLNSFKFVEKALALVEEKLREECNAWPEKKTKETWGYDSVNNKVYLQRRKEEAADYRYFPEPDLPPFDMAKFDLEKIKESTKESAEVRTEKLKELNVPVQYVSALIGNMQDYELFEKIVSEAGDESAAEAAKLIVQRFFQSSDLTYPQIHELSKLVQSSKDLFKNKLTEIIKLILGGSTFDRAKVEVENSKTDNNDIVLIIEKVLSDNQAEVERYKQGESKLFGFLVGQVMKETKGSVDPQVINKILKEKL